MKACFVFSLESPQRGDPNVYTQPAIINIKKKITLNYPKYNNVCSYVIFSLWTQERVRQSCGKTEQSVFEPLKFYCIITRVRTWHFMTKTYNICFDEKGPVKLSQNFWKWTNFGLRNRFLLTVICCPVYHWLEVSREMDISQAQSTSDIFTDDWPRTSYKVDNKSLVSKTPFRF